LVSNAKKKLWREGGARKTDRGQVWLKANAHRGKGSQAELLKGAKVANGGGPGRKGHRRKSRVVK